MFVGELRPFQKTSHDLMIEWGRALLAMVMGAGKVQPVGESVLTPWGRSRIGDLQVGDYVVGSDGRPTKVIGVYPQGVIEDYEVTFSDGATVRCGLEHLWNVQSAQDRYKGRRFKTRSLGEILEQGLHDKNGNSKHFLPLVEPVYFESESNFPLDPYAVGVLLGDGGFTTDTPKLSSSRNEIREDVFSSLKEIEVVPGFEDGRGSVNLVAESGLNTLVGLLREWGLYGCKSVEKFIPEQYLWASDPEDRLKLLQGLLDTDSERESDQESSIAFCTSSRQLAEDVRQLVQSLGGVAGEIRSRIPNYSYRGEHRVGSESYRMSVSLPSDMPPTRHRSLGSWTKYGPVRSISKVRYLGEAEGVCIKVENSDGLYVANDFVLTHNTVCTISVLEELLEDEEVEAGLIVVPPTLKFQWEKAINQFTDGANVMVIDGSRDKRIQQYKRAEKWAEYIVLGYTQVVDDWKYVRRLPRDFVVCDEVQRIKNIHSKRTKKILRLDASYKFGLTGQPLENRPEEIYTIMRWVDHNVLGRFDIFDKTFIVRNNWGSVKRYKNLSLLHERLSEQAMIRYSRADIADQLPEVVEKDFYAEFDAKTRRLYGVIAADLRSILEQSMKFGKSFDLRSHYQGGQESSSEKAIRAQIAARLVVLRMLCDHPTLLRYSADRRDVGQEIGIEEGSKYAVQIRDAELLDSVTQTPKMDMAVDTICELLEEDAKILLFSTFKPTLTWIREAVKKKMGKKAPEIVLYTGDMDSRQKQASVDAFEERSKTKLMLSTDAGGTGVDLPAGNVVINYDLPFSAGLLDQRNSRVQRLSSVHSSVTVINLLVRGSIEEHYYGVVRARQELASSVVDGVGPKRIEMDNSSLSDFLATNAP